ncbi:MAG: AzlD domain-containing protein [Pseudomonadota bacterium]
MTEAHWLLIAVLAMSTLALRLVGYLFGTAMMRNALAVRALDAFPGCLMVALIAAALARGTTADWLAATVALAAAFLTRNIILTMLLGMTAFVAATTWL